MASQKAPSSSPLSQFQAPSQTYTSLMQLPSLHLNWSAPQISAGGGAYVGQKSPSSSPEAQLGSPSHIAHMHVGDTGAIVAEEVVLVTDGRGNGGGGGGTVGSLVLPHRTVPPAVAHKHLLDARPIGTRELS